MTKLQRNRIEKAFQNFRQIGKTPANAMNIAIMPDDDLTILLVDESYFLLDRCQELTAEIAKCHEVIKSFKAEY